jgi:hypothetical protein
LGELDAATKFTSSDKSAHDDETIASFGLLYSNRVAEQ